MENHFFEAILDDLEHTIEGKEKWLNDLNERISGLSSEISKVSEITERLFISYKKISDHVSFISQTFQLPSFVSDFSSGLKAMNDRKLVTTTQPYKLQDISIKLSKWGKRLTKSLEVYDQRQHCKTLYEKIISETTKITQNYRIKEMDSIKDEFWTAFIKKHKEFQDSLTDLQSSSNICFLAPVCELISMSSEFFIKFPEFFLKTSQAAKDLLRIVGDRYQVSVGYLQQQLNREEGFGESLECVRAKMMEANCEVINRYDALCKNEISIEVGERIEITDGDYNKNWCKGVNAKGQKGFLPRGAVRVFKYATIFIENEAEHVQSLEIKEFLKECERFWGYIVDFVYVIKDKAKNCKCLSRILQLLSKLLDINSVNSLFMKEAQLDSSQALQDYIAYLPLYLDCCKTIEKLIRRFPDDAKALKLLEFLAEIKSFILSFRRASCSCFLESKSAALIEVIDITSTLLRRLSKPMTQLPTHEEVFTLLQDSKNSSIKRVTVLQNSLLLMPKYIVFASVPFKITKIVPFDDVLDIKVDEECLCFVTNKKSLRFIFDSAKRALDWMSEIDSFIVPS